MPSASGKAPSNAAMSGHQDRAKAQEAGLHDRIVGILSLDTFGRERKVDHHDGVLLHNADQQNNPNDGDNTQFGMGNLQCQQRAYAGGWKARNDGDGVDVALIKNRQDDINGRQGGGDQNGLTCKRGLVGLRGACELGVDGGGSPILAAAALAAVTASPSATPGLRLNEMVIEGKRP